MKIAFFGTGEFSTNILNWILQNEDIDISFVVSQPDKKIGRKKIISPTPIKEYAIQNNIKVLQPQKLKWNEEFFEELKGLDFIVVVAYWKIVPKEVLDAPKYWCINVHWSVLPSFRWASPIQEAIKLWKKETWLTIMYMSEGMDEWDILRIEKVIVDNIDKTQDIFNKFEKIWPDLLYRTLKDLLAWKMFWIKQDTRKATYCKKISKEDWLVKFKTSSAFDIYNIFRAYSNWPGIYSNYNWKKLNIEDCSYSKGWDFETDITEKLIPWWVIKINKKTIWLVCSDKKLLILNQVKLEWKKSMDIISFINGNKDFLNYTFE